MILKPVTLIVLAFAGNAALAGLSLNGSLASSAGTIIAAITIFALAAMAPWALMLIVAADSESAAVGAGVRAAAGHARSDGAATLGRVGGRVTGRRRSRRRRARCRRRRDPRCRQQPSRRRIRRLGRIAGWRWRRRRWSRRGRPATPPSPSGGGSAPESNGSRSGALPARADGACRPSGRQPRRARRRGERSRWQLD